ncbi:MAG: hypothetical protein Q7T35_05985 [Nitrosomonas sp.]|nr:hypothetical protein [Nitrosomonas sp.]
MIKTIFIGSFLLFFSTMVMAHEGEPNMAFAWRDGNIEVDIKRQGSALGDHTAFVISFTDTFTPYRMGDAGFTGTGFDQGGIVGYQTESTLLKWSSEQSQWLREGFTEQLVISRLSDEKIVTDKEGNGLQGIIDSLTTRSDFEAHPIFRIQKADGSLPDDGAYMVFINILGVDESGERILYKPSVPFALVFHINAQANFDRLALSQALKVTPEVQLNDYDRMDALFDWAESQNKALFPHAAESRFIFGYYVRCYDNSVCVGSKDGKIYTAGGVLGDIAEHGSIETFYDMAGL